MESTDITQKVSIIVPCRNEKKFIDKCIRSIVNNDFPKDKLEVLVVDGMSTDGTRDVVKRYSANYPNFKLLDNPKQIVSAALNKGIKNARGEIIMRMDAHSTYENDYISKCVKYLYEYNVDNVGGVCVTMPNGDTVIAKSIALALSTSFGVGNAYFRIGSKEPKYVDTVPFGCYRKDVFRKIGFFDEDLVRNQDDELNLRLIRNGGKVLLVPDIISYYHARDSLLNLWGMYYQYGYFKPLVAKKLGGVFTWRQVIPAVFVGSLIVLGIFSLIINKFIWLFFLIILFYLFGNLAFSFSIAIKKGLKYILVLPAVFSTLHFSYGLGYLKGVFDFIILKKNKEMQNKDVSLTR